MMGGMGWSLLSLVVVLVAFGFGAPFLLRGGGMLRRRGTIRFKVRGGGPGAGAVVVLALLRRADTVAFVLVTVAMLVLVVLNARA